MTELKDFDLQPSDDDGRRRTPRWPIWVGAALVVLLIVAFVFFRRSKATEPQEATATPPTAEAPEPEARAFESPPDVELPTLAASDPWLREVVGQLSSHPQLSRWLVTDELANRFVATVDNLAEGVSPRPHLPFLVPEEEFGVMNYAGGVYLDPRSYHRFDALTDTVASIDVAGAAELYRTIKPLLQEAYANLGYPHRDFDDALSAALASLLKTPVIDGEIALVPKVESYEFADPELEGLSAAQKHFLRLGPRNLRRMQAKARELAHAIGLPVVASTATR